MLDDFGEGRYSWQLFHGGGPWNPRHATTGLLHGVGAGESLRNRVHQPVDLVGDFLGTVRYAGSALGILGGFARPCGDPLRTFLGILGIPEALASGVLCLLSTMVGGLGDNHWKFKEPCQKHQQARLVWRAGGLGEGSREFLAGPKTRSGTGRGACASQV